MALNLSDLDPNVVAVATSAIGALGAWLWAKVRGKRSEDVREVVWRAVLAEIAELVADKATQDRARIAIEGAARSILHSFGVRGKAANAIATWATERGIAVFRERLAQANLPADLERLLSMAAAVRWPEPKPKDG